METEDIKLINEHLADEISKDIFADIVMKKMTNDSYYLKKIVSSSQIGKAAFDKIEQSNKPLGVFGAGAIGKCICNLFYEQVVCFIDNFKIGGVLENKPVISLSEFENKYPDGIIVVATKYYKEINHQIAECNICNEVIDLGEVYYEQLSQSQYFDLPYLNDMISDNEVFVDGGAFDGQTTLNFFDLLDKQGKNNGYSYVWEPDSANIIRIKEKLACVDENRYEVVERGLWNRSCELFFKADGTTGSRIEDSDMDSGVSRVKVSTIDEICDKKVTFIKMDIEGAEREALEGSRNTITSLKPKLAICIYHKEDDFIEIPKMILNMNSDYRLYLRHYSLTAGETVLYAL